MTNQSAPDFAAKPTLIGDRAMLRPFIVEQDPRARHVYDKVGFVAEGVLRDALRWEDRWIDAIVMSMLAPEWSRHHGRPEI